MKSINKEKFPEYLTSLNTEQVEAVLSTEGPLLVLAGAGTGKTKVLTTRIAHIISSKRAFPGQILAVTFTNKAAKEMRSRVERILPNITEGAWLGTFHSIASKILRRHANFLGLTKDFTIVDVDDQQRLLKQIIKDKNLDEKKYSAKYLCYVISRFKDKAILPEKLKSSSSYDIDDEKIIEVYDEYQKRLKSLNAVDFGDLILLNITLFNNHQDILYEYHNKFKYILVDEYQDTNLAQYLWLRILTQAYNNICCVGDDDQSIYGWRGAEVTNILKFDRDFKDAKIIRLEKNYRSTGNILTAATKVISFNQDRHGKILWTDKGNGEKVKLNGFYDDKEEARFIAEEIDPLSKTIGLAGMAILLRAGYQTRSFEEVLNFYRIPYRIIGGLKFYERAEIKDVMSYIRVLINPDDSLAFERIINTPRRGVGPTTLQEIHLYARQNNISLIKSAKELLNAGGIKGKVASALSQLFVGFAKWEEMLSNVPHWEVVEIMLQDSGYTDMWKTEATEEAKERLDNIKELNRSLQDFTNLQEYLEHVSLITDTDNISDEKVNVMTIHAAKGLEFEVVFLAGWEEGTFPSQKAIDENGNKAVEEERRLAYVGMTRAKQKLYISYTCNRRLYGSYQSVLPSRFIEELPAECLDVNINYTNYSRQTYNNQNTTPDYLLAEPNFHGEEAQYDSANGINQGIRVFHEKFGYGIVIAAKGQYTEVAFKTSGLKKVLTDFLKVA